MNAMIEYDWPGNIRELENLLERLVVINNQDITKEDVIAQTKINILRSNVEIKQEPKAQDDINSILKALEKTGYVKSRAAKLLGLTLRQLDYRIKKYNIDIPKI